MTHVIAGVDGSPRSLAALRLAVKEAAWRGAVLEAVSVYAPPQFLEAQPTSAISGTAMWAGVSPTHDAPDTLGERRDRVERQARERAAGMLAQFISSAGVDPDSVSRSVVSDQRPARALVRLSAGAELLAIDPSVTVVTITDSRTAPIALAADHVFIVRSAPSQLA